MAIHPRYLPRDTEPQSTLLSSISLIRANDQTSWLGTHIPDTVTLDAFSKQGLRPEPPKPDPVHDPNYDPSADPPKKVHTVSTNLASVLIPTAATSISRILNHPNIVSLVDIITMSEFPGPSSLGPVGKHGQVKVPRDITVWEDMNSGQLSLLLPSANHLPDFADGAAWHALSQQIFTRYSLPESLCWHVLLSISKALLWLHHGVKETEGIKGEWMRHDEDWQCVLIRDVSPGQVWFKHPVGEETYGECKLGGFQWAKVTGVPGGTVAVAERIEGASVEKQYYWAPEIYKNTHAHSRPSEIWSLGAVIYTMMTGIPPPRYYDYAWQISRLNDKGYSRPLRTIIAKMLSVGIQDRPEILELVDQSEEGWRTWRANTPDGKEYVDVRDDLLSHMFQGAGLGGPGSGRLNIVGM